MDSQELAMSLYRGILGRNPREVALPELTEMSRVVDGQLGVMHAAQIMVQSEEFRQKFDKNRIDQAHLLLTKMGVPHIHRIVFDHIPKTGGLSTIAFLSLLFGPKHVTDVRDTEGLLATPLVDILKSRVIAGHLGYQSVKWLAPSEYPRFSVFRNPLDRLVSQYAHLLRETVTGGPNAHTGLVEEVEKGFSWWYDRNVDQGQFNSMARWVTIGLAPDPDLPADTGHSRWKLQGTGDAPGLWEAARLAIDNMAVVGTLEDFEGVTSQLLRFFNSRRKKVPSLSQLNAGKDIAQISSGIEAKLRKRIESVETVDYSVWEYASEVAKQRI